MQTPGPQLPLPLAYRSAHGREDFVVGASNSMAVAWVDRWPDWPAPLLIVSGPAGSGKSHLADVWRSRTGAPVIAASALTSEAAPALLRRGALVIEDLETLTDETALFHMLNFAREMTAHLLLTLSTSPSALALRTPDLGSRLRAAPHAAIGEPDPALLAQLIARHFDARGIHASADMIDFLANRIERSAEAAREWVARIDDHALRHNRRLNMRLLREVMAGV